MYYLTIIDFCVWLLQAGNSRAFTWVSWRWRSYNPWTCIQFTSYDWLVWQFKILESTCWETGKARDTAKASIKFIMFSVQGILFISPFFSLLRHLFFVTLLSRIFFFFSNFGCRNDFFQRPFFISSFVALICSFVFFLQILLWFCLH